MEDQSVTFGRGAAAVGGGAFMGVVGSYSYTEIERETVTNMDGEERGILLLHSSIPIGWCGVRLGCFQTAKFEGCFQSVTFSVKDRHENDGGMQFICFIHDLFMYLRMYT